MLYRGQICRSAVVRAAESVRAIGDGRVDFLVEDALIGFHQVGNKGEFAHAPGGCDRRLGQLRGREVDRLGFVGVLEDGDWRNYRACARLHVHLQLDKNLMLTLHQA